MGSALAVLVFAVSGERDAQSAGRLGVGSLSLPLLQAMRKGVRFGRQDCIHFQFYQKSKRQLLWHVSSLVERAENSP